MRRSPSPILHAQVEPSCDNSAAIGRFGRIDRRLLDRSLCEFKIFGCFGRRKVQSSLTKYRHDGLFNPVRQKMSVAAALLFCAMTDELVDYSLIHGLGREARNETTAKYVPPFKFFHMLSACT